MGMKKQIAILKRGMIANAVLLIVGIAVIMTALFALQKQYSVKQAQNILFHSIDAVMDVLDANAEDADALNARVHRDNQAIVNTLAGLIYNPNGSGQYLSDQAAFSNLADTVGGNIELLTIGKDGIVKYASTQTHVGLNLVQANIFTQEQIDQMLRNTIHDDQEINGTSFYTFDGSVVIQAECEPVRARFGEDSRESYFYSSTQTEGEALVLRTYASTLWYAPC